MDFKSVLFLLIVLNCILVICYLKRKKKKYSVTERLQQFGNSARTRLKPFFNNLSYPGEKIIIVALKKEKIIEIYSQDYLGKFNYIREYPITAASGVLGPKLKVGDKQVPEGIYHPVLLNPNSKFHVSIRLNYPNETDLKFAQQDSRTDLGGDIMIHGKDKSVGCIAISDIPAEDLFTLVSDVGLPNTEVIICPLDFRKTSLNKEEKKDLPIWIEAIYDSLKSRLNKITYS